MNVSILAFPKVRVRVEWDDDCQNFKQTSILQIDTLELYYTADFVLTMRWRDPRYISFS